MSRRFRIGCALAALAAAAPGAAAEIRFAEVSAAWGVPFVHHHGGSGERYMVETTVGGVVIFDFDGDGDEDLFLVDGGVLPGYEGETPRSRLYRNEGEGLFVDYTDRSAIDFGGYGAGASAGDADGDGDPDLFVAALNENAYYENLGDGRFRDATVEAGVAGADVWSAAAGFADVDADGDLDLYVSNYVDFALDNHKFCGDESRGLQAYCHPGSYNGVDDVFYRNRGDGTFVDATAEAGLDRPAQPGLGVVFGDLDDDGWIDLYVANDTEPNFLFRNRGDGTFEDASLISGTSHGDRGDPEASMGVDLGDFDRDGRLDIVMTNFELETNGLYRNNGLGLFTDSRFVVNIAEASLMKLAFGVDFADLDNDADLDLVVANGHILDNAPLLNPHSEYRQVNQVFENSEGRFRELAGVFEIERASRGLASGDLDRDGDLDLVIVNSNEAVEVYENRLPAGRGWLQLDLASPGANRFGIGARVTLFAADRPWVEEVRTSSSYSSQNALTLHFGLGAERVATGVLVSWPSGGEQRFERLPGARVRLYETAP